MTTKIRRGSWIVTIPLAGLAVGYMMLFFLPGRKAIGQLNGQIRQTQDGISQAAGLAAAVHVAQQELNKTQAYNTTWQQRAPAHQDLSALLGRIHELAKAAGTTITRSEREPVVQHETVSQVPLVIGLSGSFSQICRFLGGLEALPAIIWVEMLKIENLGNAGPAEEMMECELTMVLFTGNREDSDYVKLSE